MNADFEQLLVHLRRARDFADATIRRHSISMRSRGGRVFEVPFPALLHRDYGKTPAVYLADDASSALRIFLRAPT